MFVSWSISRSVIIFKKDGKLQFQAPINGFFSLPKHNRNKVGEQEQVFVVLPQPLKIYMAWYLHASKASSFDECNGEEKMGSGPFINALIFLFVWVYK